MWNTETSPLHYQQVIKPKLKRPMRIPVTSCAWDHEGKRIVAGVGDGSIQVHYISQILINFPHFVFSRTVWLIRFMT